MELLPKASYGNLKRYWRRRRYQRLEGTTQSRKNLKITKFGGTGPNRKWKIKALPKLRILRPFRSPLKLLTKIKNSYMEMMINLAGNVGTLNTSTTFGGKRVPKARKSDAIVYSSHQVEERLVLEIYKALVASRGGHELTASA